VEFLSSVQSTWAELLKSKEDAEKMTLNTRDYVRLLVLSVPLVDGFVRPMFLTFYPKKELTGPKFINEYFVRGIQGCNTFYWWLSSSPDTIT
jgi:hypothetical protein